MESRLRVVRSAKVIYWVYVRGNKVYFVIAYDWRYRVQLLLTEVVIVEARVLHAYRLPSSNWYLVSSKIASQ
jgi:hypothetical protein